MNSRKFWMLIIPLALMVGLIFAGCNGSDGSDGKSAYDIAVDNGFTGTEEEWLALIYGGASAAPGEGSWFNEYCVSCHAVDGSMHQASYDQLYMEGIITVSNLAYANTGGNDVVTFEMDKFGNDLDCTDVENLSIYFAPYTGSGFELATGRLSIEGTLSYASGVCTSTNPESALGDLSTMDGLVVVYGRDETIDQIPGTRVNQARYPYAAILELGTVNYVSAANNDGCEKCHTIPFLKHGYIFGQVDQDPATDFYVCKACHLDDGDGGHFIWQLLVDDPKQIITLQNQYGEDWEESGDASLTKYAYKTRLMNDVHMSHAMEFPYPQSMSNCATCHEGKLGSILTGANFVLETCKSCHPVTGDPQNVMDAPALVDVLPTVGAITNHATFINMTTYEDASIGCSSCHTAGPGDDFNEIHTGYDPLIYTDALDGTQIADSITVTIDAADFTANTLSVTFSAAGTATAGGVALDSADIVPTILIGLYGKDTKDYLIGPHARDIDSNRNLELTLGDTNPRVSFVDSTAPTWVVNADLGPFSHLIGAGNNVQLAEIAVVPDLDVALDAVSTTFDLVNNVFVAEPAQIIDVDNCNNCHDALNTTFHLSDGLPRGRGGSIEVCRLCHISLSGGSHLEMQSRSIDSYVHAIHSFQPFDFGDIDFEDDVEALHYEHHIGFIFPTLGFKCTACHNPGTFDVPSQSGSMPGLLSASDSNTTIERNIGDVPEYVVGPAVRACGACHRVQRINSDDAVGLTVLNQHFENYGYLWENDSDDIILHYIIDTVFATLIP